MTIRYRLRPTDLKYLVPNKHDRDCDRFAVLSSYDYIFVDILEVDGDWGKLQLHYTSGDVVVGWTWLMQTQCPVEIINCEELFDGRFNSPIDN